MIDVFYFLLALAVIIALVIVALSSERINNKKIEELECELNTARNSSRGLDHRYSELMSDYFAARFIVSKLLGINCISTEDLKKLGEEIDKKEKSIEWTKIETVLKQKALI